jgi:S1-C subfamily serine protease
MRSIPDDNLAYPVLITIGNAITGTGFYLNTNKAIYLVTARHVLFKIDSDELISEKATLLSYSRDVNDKTQNVLDLNLLTLMRAGNISFHSNADVAIIRVLTINPEKVTRLLPGASIQSRAQSGILGVDISTVKQFSQILVANDVFVFGYPASLGLKDIPQIDYQKPLLRKGIVAGINESLQTIILDCPIFPGNSGGPVLEVEEEGFELIFRVIGVVSQFVPIAETWLNTLFGYSNLSIGNSGYSVATPMDFVLEMIKDMENKAIAAT